MKSILKITTVIVLLLTNAMALAAEPNPKLSTDANSKSLTFELATKGQETSVKLVDFDDEVLYFETIVDEEKYRKIFDFSHLTNGEYALIVENELNYTVHSIVVSDEIVLKGKTEGNKPYFKILEDRLAINFLNLTGEAVVISIYDSENRTVFSEELNDLVIEKAFNFEKAFADNYIVVFKTKQKSYSKSILID